MILWITILTVFCIQDEHSVVQGWAAVATDATKMVKATAL